jgi:hypothetical protein
MTRGRIWQKIHSTHSAAKARIFFKLWVARLFILFTKTARCFHRNGFEMYILILFHVCFTLRITNCKAFHSDLISLFEKLDKTLKLVIMNDTGPHLGKSKQNQEITVTNYGQNNRIFGIFFLVDFLFSSLTTPNVFIVMVLK